MKRNYQSSKEEKVSLVKTCKDIFADKKVALNTNNQRNKEIL
jgi:hypothetical protein